ncbi:SMC-Scp complex subunit ScpB [Actinoplanes oblitus]|uniref:SMC-Scp complex subunit ScpB n=1 Tax=Actinoplanes oblitus TaxID=3040509 RepID=A0ABY8WB18_9ACTN|nr:SMC-Scp complex subunit ScpB [Actinoplanes oblitus]WIM94562.1 SMC-Scp complex subunit ScpB [Actinoplanes oblitus]
MSDERPDSLAAQMGAWVPPWERKQDEPDREFQAGRPEAVDAPQMVPDDDGPEPTEVEVGPELPLPDSVEEAAEQADDEPEESVPVDAPARPETVEGPDDEPESAPADQAAAIGYLAGYHDTAERLAGDVADVTAPVPAVPAQATGPREDVAVTGGDDRTERVLDDAELAATLEAILLVVDEPTGELKLAEVLEQPVERVARALDDISARYTAAGHGFDLRRVAGGWRLYTRPEYAPYVERFVLDGQSVRLTQAALETLAVVAYKQPVTRSRISAIRGVNCDGVMRTLVTRGLIEECGTEPETGAYLYRTTALFLEKLGLNSVDQLPPLAPFLPDDVEEVLDASG